jgi:hypothetical protein
MTALEIFRLLAAEFSNLTDNEVNNWINLTFPLVSKKKFGAVYEQAVALLAAHRMKLANLSNSATTGESLIEQVGGISSIIGINSYTEDNVSVSFKSDLSKSAPVVDGEYSLTIYGQQYLQLREMTVIPICI